MEEIKKNLKLRKDWRDPEGSILRVKEKRRQRNGKLKEIEIFYARVSLFSAANLAFKASSSVLNMPR